MDYFTKWVEAEPIANITVAQAESFVWKSLICQYGLPQAIITDNGAQFDSKRFKEFLEELHVEHQFTSVAHPQSNRESKATNRIILHGLKICLTHAKSSWAKDLYNILWAYRTTSKTPTGETPFRLAFGTEAVIPLDIGLPALRTQHFELENNQAQLRANLDFLDSLREQALIRTVSYQQKVVKYYNSRVKTKAFQMGDLVLRESKVFQPTEIHKLSPKWEGLYVITRVIRLGAYQL